MDRRSRRRDRAGQAGDLLLKGLSVEVLGCDGSYPGPGGAGSGYLLTCDGTNVLLDAGPGTLANMQQVIDIEELDAVVLTHSHIDHWSDVEHAAVAIRWVVERPALRVLASFEMPEALADSPDHVLDWMQVDPSSRIEVGPMRFSFSATDHVKTTLAVRVDTGGRSIGYSADTGPGWELSGLGTDLDLALCEATFLSDREGSGMKHLSARQAGETARRAGVAKLVITHLWPRVDRALAEREASEAFGGEVEVAAIGSRFEP